MNISLKNKEAVAQFVNDQLRSLDTDFVLTTIIKREKSGEFSVFTATALSSGVIDERADSTFYAPQ